jgi:hypothetical protein
MKKAKWILLHERRTHAARLDRSFCLAPRREIADQIGNLQPDDASARKPKSSSVKVKITDFTFVADAVASVPIIGQLHPGMEQRLSESDTRRASDASRASAAYPLMSFSSRRHAAQ